MIEYELSESESSVHLWLSTRLPLEPTGNVLFAKGQLRDALSRLKAPRTGIFCARYSAIDTSVFDVENVLLYNVGTGAFSSVASNGITFSRLRTLPPKAPSGLSFPYLHEYFFTEVPEPPFGESVTAFSFSIPRISSSTRAHDVWWHATEAKASSYKPISGRFALHVELIINSPIKNVAAILKSLLDGIVSAMHTCPNPSNVAVERLAIYKKWNAEEVYRKLQKPPNPILGHRRVIDVYREFVKWDPADDLCESCTLAIGFGDVSTCNVTIAAAH